MHMFIHTQTLSQMNTKQFNRWNTLNTWWLLNLDYSAQPGHQIAYLLSIRTSKQ